MCMYVCMCVCITREGGGREMVCGCSVVGRTYVWGVDVDGDVLFRMQMYRGESL